MNATNQSRPFLFTAKPAMLLLLLSFFAIHGCAVAVIGIGAGAGAVAYFNGKLTKTYESDYHETVRAGKDVLKRLKIPVSEIISDELKTEIKAKRPDGTPVTIEVVRIDQNHNEVSVRTGAVGVWDRRVSEQIHGYIDDALGGKVVLTEKPPEGQAAEVTAAMCHGCGTCVAECPSDAITQMHFTDAQIRDILGGNWIRFLERTLPADTD